MQKFQKPELIAPLNDWKTINEQGNVLENGDGFYFGLQNNFSMRAYANNFSEEDLPKLMKIIKDKGKKAYICTNITIYDGDIENLKKTLSLAKKAEVDAVICHDIAAIELCKGENIKFHISTQANISNVESAMFYQRYGAERIILARELSLEQIRHIISKVSIPIECFIHGAMCTAISGRCYLSAELNDFDIERSANRGKCTQPCRRIYNLIGENGEKIEYEPSSGRFFNAKDLCMIDHIDKLINCGIATFKIEGRMRDPIYISEVTRCYREAIDSVIEGTFTPERISIWMNTLKKVFNRGFHTGFYFGKPKPEDIEFRIRGNVSEYHKEWIGKVTNFYKKVSVIEIDLANNYIKTGDELIFENRMGFFYRQNAASIYLKEKQIEKTELANFKNHIVVTIKVNNFIPSNSDVYVVRAVENDFYK